MRDGAALGGVLTLSFDGNRVVAEDVQFAFGKRLLVQLAAFRRWRDRVEHTGVGDTCFSVVGNELVAVRGDTDPGVGGLFDHGSLEDCEGPGVAGLQSRQAEQMSVVSSGPMCSGWQHVHGSSHALSQSGYG